MTRPQADQQWTPVATSEDDEETPVLNGTHGEVPSPGMGEVQIKLYKRRWLMLFLFCITSMANAIHWLMYTIIANITTRYYNVSEITINWTSIVYMLAYVPLVLPASWVIEKKGLRVAIILGAALMSAGAWLKVVSAAPDRFDITFIGQTVVGVAQMFTLGIPGRLAAVWFGEKEVSFACAVGVFGNQLGIALGFLIPPAIVGDHEDLNKITSDLKTMYYVFAALPTLILILCVLHDGIVWSIDSQGGFIIFATDSTYWPRFNNRAPVRIDLLSDTLLCVTSVGIGIPVFESRPPCPPSLAQAALLKQQQAATANGQTASSGEDGNVTQHSPSNKLRYFQTMKPLLTNFNYLLLLVSYGMNVGTFYAVSTLLNPLILENFPVDKNPNAIEDAGRVGLTMVLMGVLGSIAGGLVLDTWHKFKETTIVVYLLAVLGMVTFTFSLTSGSIVYVYITAGFLGFFTTGYVPIGYEFGAELTYPHPESTTVGILNLAGESIGIALVLGTGEIFQLYGGRVTNYTFIAALVCGLVLCFFVKSELRRLAATRQQQSQSNAVPIKESTRF